MDNRPIGIFDSGLGGLTVLKEIVKYLPTENFIYFGDCGRIPYGTKSRETVQKYTIQDINFLKSMDVKAIIIACNTASAHAYEIAKNYFDIPVFEVISPGAKAAIRETKNKRIGVIGTKGTISTSVYEKAINSFAGSEDVEIFSKACPLFVPLAEEGWWYNDIAHRIAEEYLNEFKDKDIDTLVLGCTHYPLLGKTIQKVMGQGTKLVTSGAEIANSLNSYLEKNNLFCNNNIVEHQFFTSDSVEDFKRLGRVFLGMEIPQTEHVSIERF